MKNRKYIVIEVYEDEDFTAKDVYYLLTESLGGGVVYTQMVGESLYYGMERCGENLNNILMLQIGDTEEEETEYE